MFLIKLFAVRAFPEHFGIFHCRVCGPYSIQVYRFTGFLKLTGKYRNRNGNENSYYCYHN